MDMKPSDMKLSVLLLTAPPTGQVGASGGASDGAFIKLDGREAMLRAIELFLNRDGIDQIQIVFDPRIADHAKERHGAHFSFSGVRVLTGGPTWIDQLIAGTQHLDAESTHVLIHDAARVAVPEADLQALIAQAHHHPAVALAAPLREALVELDDLDEPVAWHAPARFVQLLTPQIFTKQKLQEFITQKREPHASELHLVPGSGLNVRLNGPGDAGLVKAMLKLLPRPTIKGPSNPFEEAQW